MSGFRQRVDLLAVTAATLIATWPHGAAGQEFHVDRTAENVVRFISHAPIDEFEGVTQRIDGFVMLDRPTLDEQVRTSETEFYFEVDLASLDTGIGLRNRHMRDNYLEVREHPYATLSGRLGSVSVREDGGFALTADGTLAIHGIERSVSVPCTVGPEDDGYRVRCEFEVLLSDYEIEIPSVMFLKLANDIRLELDFALRPASTSRREIP